MALTPQLDRFLPSDPGYAPFGWRWLRGLNVVPIALVGLVCLLGSLGDLAGVLTFRGQTSFMQALDRAPHYVLGQNVMRIVPLTTLIMAIVAAINLTARRSSAVRIAALVVAVALGALPALLVMPRFGCAFEIWRPSYCVAQSILFWGNARAYIFIALAGMLLALPTYFFRREHDATQALRDAKLQRLNAQRQETEWRLRSLQAQIEPHFLFNTLAHIGRLHEVDARLGRVMLNSLIDYMRSALPQMREPESTLGRELALTRAYVKVQQIRMGQRLRAEIDVPDTLLDAHLPAMMLLTLAENAVKHGLGSKREGGTLRISATRAGDRLRIVVSDDGVGLRLGAGSGHGLSNTRARLAARFGAQAVLDLCNNDGGGVRATLLLPFEPARAQACAS